MRMYLQGQTLNEQFAKPGHIVVATDLGDLDFLLPHAIAQAKTCDAALILAHAVTGGDSKVPFGAEHPGQFEIHAQELDTAMRKVKAEGVNCTSQIAHAILPDEFLHNVVRETGSQRVIMASHGHGNFGQVTLGSVAHQLLSTLKVPFFVVGPKSHAQSQHCYPKRVPIFAVGPKVASQASYCNPKRILHPVSFSNEREISVEFALKLAEAHGAELMLMHVHEPGADDESKHDRMHRLTEEAGLVFSVPTHTNIAYGNVVEEIINTACVFGADWLILGTSPIAAAPMSYTPFSATNKAYRLMAAANIPVLTFPHRIHSMNPSSSKDNAAFANTHALG